MTRGVALVTALLLTGCGGEDSAAEPSGGSKLGGFGRLEFAVTPAQPIIEGENHFHVLLRDAANHAPFDAQSLSVEPLMGSMGHPSPIEPDVIDRGAGSYDVDGVVFSMPGVWELRLRASKGDLYDDVAFAFDVP